MSAVQKRTQLGLGFIFAGAVAVFAAQACVGAEPTLTGEGLAGGNPTSGPGSGPTTGPGTGPTTGPGSTTGSSSRASSATGTGGAGGQSNSSAGSSSGGAAAAGGGGSSSTGTPVVPGAPGTALTSGGTVSKSASYKLVGAVSESPGGHTPSASANYGLHSGLLGTTQ